MKSPKQFAPILDASDVNKFLDDRGTVIGVDVDTQVGFMEERGNLFVPARPSVKTNIALLCKHLRYRIGSVDSHAFDAWEFQKNGGPFPAHCVKGTEDWLKVPETRIERMRFVPMSEGHLVIGEARKGGGNRSYEPRDMAFDVMSDDIAIFFEKEVYSMFANPNAEPCIDELVRMASGTRRTLFAVFGYCTGGYCVDTAAEGLRERGYNTAIIMDATAPIGHDGTEKTWKMAKEKNIHILQTADLVVNLPSS